MFARLQTSPGPAPPGMPQWERVENCFRTGCTRKHGHTTRVWSRSERRASVPEGASARQAKQQ
eukprot:5270098-Alexandrium_andersonii.AAC.1